MDVIVNDDLPIASLAKGKFSRQSSVARARINMNEDDDDEKPTKPIIGTNQRGTIFIRWIDPAYKDHWVRVASVMNRGTYSVHQHCPVSKAHYIFTALGLRHLVVLGGGGRVVGILTRMNMIKDSIRERTGVAF